MALFLQNIFVIQCLVEFLLKLKNDDHYSQLFFIKYARDKIN